MPDVFCGWPLIKLAFNKIILFKNKNETRTNTVLYNITKYKNKPEKPMGTDTSRNKYKTKKYKTY